MSTQPITDTGSTPNPDTTEHPDCPCPDDTHVGPDHGIFPDGGTFFVTGPPPGRHDKNVALALQHAVERGKLRPFEAIEAAEFFGVLLEGWVQRQHDHYVANTGTKKQA